MHRFAPTDLIISLGLLGMGFVLRRGSLGPSSLWLDDAWAAAVARADTPAEIWRVSFLTPGFSIVLDRWIDLVGFSTSKAQALPLAAGLATPILAYTFWRRHLGRPGALLAAVVLTTSPILITYSTRVKAYTFDTFVATCLLSVALGLIESRDTRRWWGALVVVAILATLVSPTVVPVIGGAFLACSVATLRRDRAEWRTPAVAGAVYAAFAIVWLLLFLLPRQQDVLIDFWKGYYIPVGDGLGALGETYELLVYLAEGLTPLPGGLVVVSLALVIAVLARRSPQLALVGGCPILVAVLLAAAQRMPLGGGRTDAILYPSLALLVGASVSLVAVRWLAVAIVLGVSSLLVVLAPVARPECDQFRPVEERGRVVDVAPVPLDALECYPNWDLAPLIAAVEAEAGPDDVILVHPLARWAYALYTRADVQFTADDTYGTGFDVRVADPRVRILGGARPVNDDPGLVSDAPRVWYVGADRDDALGVRLDTRLALGRLEYTLIEERGFSWERFADREPGPEGVAWVEVWVSAEALDRL